jgi:hypothetical protein
MVLGAMDNFISTAMGLAMQAPADCATASALSNNGSSAQQRAARRARR